MTLRTGQFKMPGPTLQSVAGFIREVENLARAPATNPSGPRTPTVRIDIANAAGNARARLVGFLFNLNGKPFPMPAQVKPLFRPAALRSKLAAFHPPPAADSGRDKLTTDSC